MATTPDTQAAAAQAAQAGQSQQLTPTDLATAVALALKQAAPPPQQQQRQMSQAEIDQMLGTYNPGLDLVHALFGPDAERDNPRLEALSNFVRAVVANATGHAHVVSQDYVRRLYDNISEPLEDAKYVGQQRFFDDIYKGHDGLKEYDPFVRTSMAQLSQREDYPRDREQRVAYVRAQMTPIIKQIRPDFDPVKGSQQAQTVSGQHQQQQRQSQGLPSLGGGGSGASVPATTPGQAARLPWDTSGHGF